MAEPVETAEAFPEAGIEFSGVIEKVGSQVTRFKPGDRVAIIGQTGAGKSTLVSLIAGLYEPLAGTVAIDPALGRLSFPVGEAPARLQVASQDRHRRVAVHDGPRLGRTPVTPIDRGDIVAGLSIFVRSQEIAEGCYVLVGFTW